MPENQSGKVGNMNQTGIKRQAGESQPVFSPTVVSGESPLDSKGKDHL